MNEVSGAPRSGVITRSAWSKVALTIGSELSSLSMLTYWLPWPV